ncbi:MAG: 50S ribosomal protein L10 [Phycisphaerales bacterium]|jgi:large subunit ribosomal protein L10|nr:50S ribosomal protein L10 [Phycisphaerales bacterium]
MSKPVKEMIIDEYRRRFENVDGGVILQIRGMDALENNEFRNELRKKSIHITVLKNTLAKKAFVGTDLEVLFPALKGPAAIAFGSDSPVDVAREIVEWGKKVKELELCAASIDGVYFDGEAGVKALAKFPTRDEAKATVVTILLTPHRNVVGCAKSPGSKLMGVVKSLEEKLESGETIAKVG